MGNGKIEVVDNIKILGAFFSGDLTWNKHVEYLWSKVSSAVGIITRLRNILPVKILLYNSLGLSLLQDVLQIYLIMSTLKSCLYNIIFLLCINYMVIDYCCVIKRPSSTIIHNWPWKPGCKWKYAPHKKQRIMACTNPTS